MLFGKRKEEEQKRLEEAERLQQQLSDIQKDLKKQRMAVENITDEWEDFREGEESRIGELLDWKNQEDNFIQLFEEYQEQLEGLKKYAGNGDKNLFQQIQLVEEKLEKKRRMCGISQIAEAGRTVDYDLHEVIQVLETDNPQLKETVAEIYSPGYIYKGKVRKKAKVSAYCVKEKDTDERE